MRFLKKMVKNGNTLYMPMPKDLSATCGFDAETFVIIEENQSTFVVRKALPHEIEAHKGKNLETKQPQPNPQ